MNYQAQLDFVAIVLAAGKGTRMRSSRSKLLHPILGEPLVSYPLHALYQAGIRHFVVVVGYLSEDVSRSLSSLSFLKDPCVQLHFVVQHTQQGTGDAVKQALLSTALPLHLKNILIVCGDSPHLDVDTLLQMINTYQTHEQRLCVLGAHVENPYGYGRLHTSADGRCLYSIVEEKEATLEIQQINLVNAGVYAVSRCFLADAVQQLKPHVTNGEYYLTDIANLLKDSQPALVVTATNPSVVLGVNSQTELLRSQNLIQARIIKGWQDKGVCILGSDVMIGPYVLIDSGVVIEHGVTLLGHTYLAAEVWIEHHVHLKNMHIGHHTRVKSFTYAEDSLIHEHVTLGPMARLRTQTEIGAHAEIGNFCEIKKSTIHEKAKAHHVSYLGDSDVGARTNIGAGTIICNYNGVSKPHSYIGADVFVGSHSTLVAPVDIQDSAYIAAGSTITEPVPAHALAIGRSKQINKIDYVNKLKDKLKKQKNNL